jgi:hypothetical protein
MPHRFERPVSSLDETGRSCYDTDVTAENDGYVYVRCQETPTEKENR